MATAESYKTKQGTRWKYKVRLAGHPSQTRSGFFSRDEALKEGQKIERQLKAGVALKKRKGVTIADAAAKYLEVMTEHENLAGTDKERILKKIKNCDYDIGYVKVDHLTANAIINWITRYKELGDTTENGRKASKYRSKQGVSPATCAKVLSTLRQLWAAKHFTQIEIPKEPFDEAYAVLKKKKIIGNSKPRERRMEEGEFNAIMKEILNRNPNRVTRGKFIPLDDLFVFSLHTAMRRSTVCDLLWKNYDKQRGRINARLKDKHDREYHQWIVLSPSAMEIIDRQPKNSDRIFPYESRSIQMAYARCRKRAFIKLYGEKILEDEGFVWLTWHDLRAEAATRLFELDMKPEIVAMVTGHRDMEVLQGVYDRRDFFAKAQEALEARDRMELEKELKEEKEQNNG